MRILVLTKRHYMGKDLLTDSFGRYFEIPEGLAKLGHEVTGLALNYHKSGQDSGKHRLVQWHSVDLLPFPPLAITRYVNRARRIIKDFKPDVIWAVSDAIHGILGASMGHIYSLPCVLDLYDNYEAYGLTNVPGIKPLFVRSCRAAPALSVVGERLKIYVSENYGKDAASVHVLQNAIRDDLFIKIDKHLAREKLGLPETAKLVGTAGALTTHRGIDILFEAFLSIANESEDVYLVVAGQRDKQLEKYNHPRIIDLGTLPIEQVPLVFNALDVAVICNKRSTFGEYCFPQKFYEILSCGTPLVAANVGELQDKLKNYPDQLFDVESTSDLVRAIKTQLDDATIISDIEIPNWSTQALATERILESAIS